MPSCTAIASEPMCDKAKHGVQHVGEQCATLVDSKRQSKTYLRDMALWPTASSQAPPPNHPSNSEFVNELIHWWRSQALVATHLSNSYHLAATPWTQELSRRHAIFQSECYLFLNCGHFSWHRFLCRPPSFHMNTWDPSLEITSLTGKSLKPGLRREGFMSVDWERVLWLFL